MSLQNNILFLSMDLAAVLQRRSVQSQNTIKIEQTLYEIVFLFKRYISDYPSRLNKLNNNIYIYDTRYVVDRHNNINSK